MFRSFSSYITGAKYWFANASFSSVALNVTLSGIFLAKSYTRKGLLWLMQSYLYTLISYYKSLIVLRQLSGLKYVRYLYLYPFVCLVNYVLRIEWSYIIWKIPTAKYLKSSYTSQRYNLKMYKFKLSIRCWRIEGLFHSHNHFPRS